MFPGGFPTKFKHQTFPPLTETIFPQSYRARCVALQQKVICKADNMKMIPTRTLNETKRAGWQVATLQWALLQFSAGTKVVARHGEEEGGGALDGEKALVRIIHFVWVFGVTSHQHTHTHTRRDNPPPLCQYWIRVTHHATGVCACPEDPLWGVEKGKEWASGERERVEV